MKDLFSQHSDDYLQFRPGYPAEAIQYIISLVKHRGIALDCGTGNGQLATALAPFFDTVYATDLSQTQLVQAPQLPNVIYQVARGEEIISPPHFFDLTTVGQAVHWFDFDRFYETVRFSLKPDGIIALLGYGLLQVPGETDQVISHLYRDVLGSYWDQERRYLDESYKTLPFPFEEIKPPQDFAHRVVWTLDQLMGYLNTWSAVKHYQKATGRNPLTELEDRFRLAWGQDTTRQISFPTLLRVGICRHDKLWKSDHEGT